MEDLLKCDICKNRFNLDNRKPLIAKCGHTFCKHCILSNLGEKNNNSCPECNAQFVLSIESCISNYKLEELIKFVFKTDKAPQIAQHIIYIKPDVKRNMSPAARTNYFAKENIQRIRSNTATKSTNDFKFTHNEGGFFANDNLQMAMRINRIQIDEEKNNISETLETIPLNEDKSVINLSIKDDFKELLDSNMEDINIKEQIQREENEEKEKKDVKDENDKEIKEKEGEKEGKKEKDKDKEEKEEKDEKEEKEEKDEDSLDKISKIIIEDEIIPKTESNVRHNINFKSNQFNTEDNNSNLKINHNINITNNTNNLNLKIQNINIINSKTPKIENHSKDENTPQHQNKPHQQSKNDNSRNLLQMTTSSKKDSTLTTPKGMRSSINLHNFYNSNTFDAQKQQNKNILSNPNTTDLQNPQLVNTHITNLRTSLEHHTPTHSDLNQTPIASPKKLKVISTQPEQGNNNNNNMNSNNSKKITKAEIYQKLKLELMQYLPNSNDSYTLTKKKKYEEYLIKSLKNQKFSANYPSLHVQLYQNGDLFIGFLDPYTSKPINGLLFASSGDYYEGEFLNDKKEGYGILIYKNGTRYEGVLKNNKHNGYGKLIQLDGEVFIGEWKDGKINGHGVRYHSNGDRYIGCYVNNIRNGNGHYIFANGDSYEGNWVNGKANGKGKFVFKNGNVYEGEFKNNLISGVGVFAMNNGDVYTGTFQNGLINGKGSMKTRNGEIYQGEFANGKKHGYGKIIGINGKVIYGGYWNNDNFVEKKNFND